MARKKREVVAEVEVYRGDIIQERADSEAAFQEQTEVQEKEVAKLAETISGLEIALNKAVQETERVAALLSAERDAVTVKLHATEVARDGFDNTLRNLNNALGKPGEMDSVQACTESAKELADYKLSVGLLDDYLIGKDLLQGATDPVKAAMQVIETFLEATNEASDEEG